MSDFAYTKEQMLRDNPLEEVIRKSGVELKPRNGSLWAVCPFHKEKTASFKVDGNVFHCFGCHAGGSVIDYLMKFYNRSLSDVMKELTPERFRHGATRSDTPRTAAVAPKPEPKPPEEKPEPPPEPGVKPVIEKIYDYKDEFGNLAYQAIRLKPKSFRQRHQVNGQWVWNMNGVTRVLYNLPNILKSKIVWVVEGEKDADNLNALGFHATCNVGGAGKWLDGYNEALRGKTVVLCGDNDEPGQKHIDLVLQSLAGKVKEVRLGKVPEPHKDVSDLIETFDPAMPDKEKAQRVYDAIVAPATIITRGVNIPIYSMAEMEQRYHQEVLNSKNVLLDLGKWLPTLGRNIRPLVPGEVVAILADTGVGKTMLLQNISIHAAPLKSLLFEFELPETLTFERYVSSANGLPSQIVFNNYLASQFIDWRSHNKLNHIFCCPEAGLSPEDLERLIGQAELKMGEKPKVVLIDYMQLVKGKGKRYERVSDAAEQIKVIAKRTKTIVIVASQIHRPEGEDCNEVGLHDAKESGSIENSAGLVLGVWRDTQADPTGSLMKIKILKCTKGKAGAVIDCNVDGEKMLINERSKIDPSVAAAMENEDEDGRRY